MRLADIIQAHVNDTKVANRKTKRHGLHVTVEHAKGTIRRLHDDAGNEVYKTHMYHDYGYFTGTKGRDGDEVDCFLGPVQTAKEIYVIHMKDMGPIKSEREDEDKCMVGFPSADAAKAAFLLHYPVKFYDGMTSLPVAVFKKRLRTAQLPHRTKKIHGTSSKTCADCGGVLGGLIAPDFATRKCEKCGKLTEQVGQV